MSKLKETIKDLWEEFKYSGCFGYIILQIETNSNDFKQTQTNLNGGRYERLD